MVSLLACGLTQSIDVIMLSLIRAMPCTLDLFIGSIKQINLLLDATGADVVLVDVRT
jgi:hypothetical protein